MRQDKEDDFILIKEIAHQEEITILNMYSPNTGSSDVMKQMPLDLKVAE